jgi:hypothetical protein
VRRSVNIVSRYHVMNRTAQPTAVMDIQKEEREAAKSSN